MRARAWGRFFAVLWRIALQFRGLLRVPQNSWVHGFMSPDTQLVIGPNASLTASQAWMIMAGIGAIALGIAGVWAVLGFWPILPFAGLELAAVGAALWVCLRRNRYREVLTFRGPVLRVEFGALGLGAKARYEFRRAWTQVTSEAGATRHDPTHLHLVSGAQHVEIGRCLTDAERVRLAARIRELL